MGAVVIKPWYRRYLALEVALLLLVIYPFFPFLDELISSLTGEQLRLDRQLVNIFIFAILALALNLQVGYAGLLQLGIAAFFAIGAFTTGVLSVEKYPFQFGFWGSLVMAPMVAGLAGLLLGAPTVRLKGDYLAIVTLGFGEVVRVVTLNLDAITDGPRGLSPIPSAWIPSPIASAVGDVGNQSHFVTMYFVALILLVTLVGAFALLERSRSGRAFVALREDELASACMGINPARTKLYAFAAGAAIAGLAGALYATNLKTTAEPNTYDFNYSIIVLCCIIIGGLGSLRGVLLGVGVLITFDSVLSPLLTKLIQKGVGDSESVFLSLTNWKLMIFGLALILTMRFKPEGLWPNPRVKQELHEENP
jgi:branched-chain amino acid transport system permease protein